MCFDIYRVQMLTHWMSVPFIAREILYLFISMFQINTHFLNTYEKERINAAAASRTERVENMRKNGELRKAHFVNLKEA